MVDKRSYLLQTLLLIDKVLADRLMTITLNKIKDTVAHTAPEMLDARWNNIYLFCLQYVQDASNPSHMKCFHLYQKRFTEYKNIFH